MRVGCSGQVSERSGIGVVQKHVYSYLADAGHDLVQSQARDVGTSATDKARGLALGLRQVRGPVDVYLSAVPPLPIGVQVPLLTLVYDLRWLRTRSRLGAMYRSWDLRRTVSRSDALVCISDSTRRSLIEFDARASKISIAQLLGAGLVPDGSFKESRTGLLIMIGGAAHKRNEDAAAALRVARPPWVTGILGVGVSAEVRDTLSDVFPCEWFQNISDDELLNLYHRAEFYLMLGTDEGFGLPFVEALAAGCQVIATDHPLAREIVGDAGHLIAPGGVAEVASQLRYPPAIPSALRAAQADRFSWKKFGEAVEVTLFEIAERGKSC